MRTVIAWTVVATLAAATTLGCKKRHTDDDTPSADTATATSPTAAAPSPATPAPKAPHHPKTAAPGGAPAPAGPAPVLGDKIEIPQAHVQFNAPGGWKKNMTANGWALFKAPDNHARLGYVAFEHPGEATTRIGQLAEAFDLSGLTWGSPTDGAIGRDHFPDHEGDTLTCTMKNGDPCNMKYMTINPGGVVQIMVVYLVNTAHGEHQRSHATASVNSIRRM